MLDTVGCSLRVEAPGHVVSKFITNIQTLDEKDSFQNFRALVFIQVPNAIMITLLFTTVMLLPVFIRIYLNQ